MTTGDILGVVMQSDVGASGGVAHQAVEPSLAPEFSASSTYAAGDFVMKDGVLYICSTAHTTAAWDESHFTAVNAGTYLTMVAAANAVASGGVAPGGFGLGSVNPSHIADNDANLAVATGLYYTHPNTLNIPTYLGNLGGYGTIFVMSRAYNDRVQIYSTGHDSAGSVGLATRRAYKSGDNYIWTDWEYVNPPLVADTEYRTTERFLGKPVYIMSKAAIVTAALMDVSAALVTGAIDQIVDFGISVNNAGYITTGIDGAGTPIFTVGAITGANRTGFHIYAKRIDSSTDMSAMTGYGWIKYTKDET